MAFDPDAFLASTSSETASSGFDPDKFLAEPSPNGFWSDTGQNAVEAIEGLPGAMKKSFLKFNPFAQGIAAAKSGAQFIQGKPITETPIAEIPKDYADLMKDTMSGAWQGLKDTGSLAKMPFEYLASYDKPLAETEFAQKFRERPFSAPLGVVGTLSLAGSGLKAASSGLKALRGAGTVSAAEDIATAGIPKKAPLPGKGPIPEPEIPPPGVEPPSPGGTGSPPGIEPLKEVFDSIKRTYSEQAAKPGRIERAGRYLQNVSQELGAKDIGLQPRQIQSMGPGFQGLEKAEALIDYARDQGYFEPTLTDVARKAKIQDVLKTTGRQVEGVRAVADTRGIPPILAMREQLQTQLMDKWGIDAPREIKTVLKKFDKAAKENPTFSSMAELATDLNKAKTAATKMGQHAGPTTDAANIISRVNNDALRALLNPEESELYTKSLQDFGAHKKLEQAVSAAGRRSAAARSNQRGFFGRMWQEALDRGGYRFAGNIAHKIGKGMVENPAKYKTMPQFFEELAHESGDLLDDIMEGPQYAHGGIVGEMDAYLTPRYGGKR